MSPKARTGETRRDIQVAEPEGAARPDTVTEVELEAIRRRLAQGFYDRPEIRDAVVEAVRKELDSTRHEA
jgi:hypothetical protein